MLITLKRGTHTLLRLKKTNKKTPHLPIETIQGMWRVVGFFLFFCPSSPRLLQISFAFFRILVKFLPVIAFGKQW